MPPDYRALVAEIKKIIAEDECNDTYGASRMRKALLLKRGKSTGVFPHIPHMSTIHRIMRAEGFTHKFQRRLKVSVKAAKRFEKLYYLYLLQKYIGKDCDLLKQDFSAENPCQKCVTDITELPTADGKLYVSAIFDCFDNAVLGLSMDDNMCAKLVCDSLVTATKTHHELTSNNAIVHSDCGAQYQSELYKTLVESRGIRQSMNSGAGRCYDNAKCESMWGRFKGELIYNRYDTAKMPMNRVKLIIRRYFLSYWNHRRICPANEGGLPPMVKRRQYYEKHRGSIMYRNGSTKATFSSVHPELAKQWHPTRNGDLRPDMVTPKSHKKVWWICELGHEWTATVASRAIGGGCPYCSCRNRKVLKGFNDLCTTNPQLAAQWHPTRNGDLRPDMVTTCSGKKVWWKCELGHEWQAKISDRDYGQGCPVCSNRRVLKGFNDLATTNPELAAEWNYDKNGELTPQMVVAGTRKRVWWKCEKGHEWCTDVHSRNCGSGCTECFHDSLRVRDVP